MTDREIIELVKSMKEKAPNQFFETIGIMKGIKIMAEKNESNSEKNPSIKVWKIKNKGLIDDKF